MLEQLPGMTTIIQKKKKRGSSKIKNRTVNQRLSIA